ncbi:lipid-A-disaccharide synthase [Histidinibacterium lentulum]|uniref:Lipid-A-disaccharide synthase n=1 Tax=Histidinibacterium lentulum TaxID=2480588 RepID=A0A3N2QL27_9RHOB|nr:lipid-A-disaccharide synthase [Histidinibacterium lentulum]ROT95899.1 lipid-A-disaccharide synthase [Histidinibacterium lentulum]
MKVFLIAGEPSGDALGAALMAGLVRLSPAVSFEGIGGEAMAGEGLVSRFPMSELTVMGIAEVLPRYAHLKRRIRETAEAVIAARPDVLITIDSPDFCLRVARRVRAVSDVRIVHYVAPSVWAWRPGRARKMADLVDQVLALLPFEPPYFEAEGLRCDFVGHPVTAAPVASPAEAQAFRAARGLGRRPVILALPGSRRSEVSRLAAPFGAALARVIAARPEARVVLPVAPGVAELAAEAAKGWPGEPLLIPPGDAAQKRAAFRAADVALAASGTVSLELAAAETPMVIAYDQPWLTRIIVKRMLRIDTVTLVNLVSGTRAVPEFLNEACRPGPISDALLTLLDAPGGQRAAMAETMRRLGRGGDPPGLRAARAVLDALG